MALMDAVRSVDWAAWSMPPATEQYLPARVPAAFEELLSATSEPERLQAYNSVMNAVAHNHSGWVYAAAVPAAPLLARAARERDGQVRRTALEILADLLCFTVAGQQFTGPAGEIISTRDATRRAAWELLPVVRDLQAEGEASGARSARFLIKAIEGTSP
jgi:hypothetical protein